MGGVHKCKFCIVWDSFIVKITALRQFKMEVDQTVYSKLEPRCVTKFWLAEKCKPWELYKKMFDEYRKAHF